MRAETDRELYVYALSSPALPRRLSVLGRRLNCIRIGDVSAIVERSNRPRRDLGDIQLQHRIVSRLAALYPALLPARFGSVVSEAALGSLVSERHDEIRAALRRVRNCEQMTVRVFGPADAAAPVEASPASGTEYLTRRREHAHRHAPEVEVIRRELSAVVKAERLGPGERGIRVSVYHLVARGAVPRYRRRAAVLQSMLAPFAVTVTGPWPVFAFAPELF
jgi:hypothetical protein